MKIKIKESLEVFQGYKPKYRTSISQILKSYNLVIHLFIHSVIFTINIYGVSSLWMIKSWLVLQIDF